MIELAARRYADFFSTLTPDRLADAELLFHPDATFRDPFNDVVGIESIKAIFAHMFAELQAPRFEILAVATHEHCGYFHWRFSHRLDNGDDESFEGMSRVRFDAAGLAREHIDFWDPTEPVYQRVPLLATLLRWLRRRLGAPTPTRTASH